MSSLPFQYLLSRGAAMMAIAVLLGGCVNATVDEMTYNEPVAGIGESSVVILGRRHKPDYDTEFDFHVQFDIYGFSYFFSTCVVYRLCQTQHFLKMFSRKCQVHNDRTN